MNKENCALKLVDEIILGLYIFGVFCSIIRYEYNFEVSHFVHSDLKFTKFSNDLTFFFFWYERTSIAW